MSRKKWTPHHQKKFKRKAKYEPKLMCWMAISLRGHSKPYFHSSRSALDSKIYNENCIKNCLVPFIKKYDPNNDFMFWPDGASAH